MQQLQVSDLGSNEVILDFNEHQLGHINIVQGDTLSRYLLITVVGPDGTIYQANPNIELRLYGVNSNYPERIIVAYGTTFGHQYKVYIPSNMVTKAGELTIQVGLYEAGATEALIQSEKKVIPVLESMAHGGDVGGDAILDLGDLNLAIAKAQNLETEYNANLAEQQTIKADIDSKHTSVTSMYTDLSDVLATEQSRVEAEDQRESQEGQRQANETKRTSDFNAQTTANQQSFDTQLGQHQSDFELQFDNQQSTFTSQLGQQQTDFDSQTTANQQTFDTAEATREVNETTRKSNEVTRKSQEDARVLAENTRNDNETTRENQEVIRQANEEERKADENTRQANEDDRKLNEQSRINEESRRSTAEADRQRAENDRKTVESSRVLAESTREAKFNSWELQMEGVAVADATDISTGVVKVKSKPDETAPYTVPTMGTIEDRFTATNGAVAGKQDSLIAGDNVTIIDNTISAKDTTYTAGNNINIVDGVISGTAQYDDTAISQRITTLENKEDKDTITTINGKTGAISKADITALGIPSQDTVYEKPASEPMSYITGLQESLDSKVNLSRLTFVENDKTYLGKFVIDNGQPKIIAEEVL